MRNKKIPDGKFVYKSLNTGEYVMCHQWIAEVLVQRKLERDGEVAPDKYWLDNNHPLTKEFLKQAIKAAKLIKEYSEEAILNFLKNNRYKFSLFPKNNIELISKEQDLINTRQRTIQLDTVDANVYILRKTGKKTLLGKLNGKKNSSEKS